MTEAVFGYILVYCVPKRTQAKSSSSLKTKKRKRRLAMENELVKGSVLSPDWLEKRRGIMAELDRQLIQGIVTPGNGLTLEQLQIVTEHRDPFVAQDNSQDPHGESKETWKRIYRKHFGMKVDFTNINIPECPGSVTDYWLVIVAKEMLSEKIFLACKKAFGGWKWTDKNLDEIVTSVRSAKNESYAIWVRARVEADEEFKNLSANELKARGHKGITLEERMLLEVMYFEQTGEHLDIQNITFCAGSLYSDGDIPIVHWFGGKMRVYWYNPDDAHDFLRSREAVS